MMPFKISELSNFKNVRTLAPGAAVILADGDEKTGFEAAPFMIIGLIGIDARPRPTIAAASPSRSRPRFPACATARITMSEPVRIDGQPGYETRIDAISGKDNTPVTVVQWLRFGAQTSLRIIGSSPRDDWTKAFPRFRAVRDGIQPRG